MLFLQGWRVNEVLGLAWQDVDLDAGVTTVRRGAVYVDGVGVTLGPGNDEGAEGVHYLAPSVIELLRRRRCDQNHEREVAGPAWPGPIAYEGE